MNSSVIKRLLTICAAMALSAGFLAACGSDDSSTDSGSTALSSEDFISQTNAICKKSGGAIDDAASEFSSAPSGADLRGFVKDSVLPNYSAQIGQIDALVPPDDISDDVDTWLADSTAVRDAIGDDPTAVLTPDAFTDVNKEADDLGLSADCQAGPDA
jgi:hypothetical protein